MDLEVRTHNELEACVAVLPGLCRQSGLSSLTICWLDWSTDPETTVEELALSVPSLAMREVYKLYLSGFVTLLGRKSGLKVIANSVRCMQENGHPVQVFFEIENADERSN